MPSSTPGLASPRLLTGQVTQVYCTLTCRRPSQSCSQTNGGVLTRSLSLGFWSETKPDRRTHIQATLSFLNCIQAGKNMANDYHEMYMGTGE